jgi:outer membrane protein assembly factor BamE
MFLRALAAMAALLLVSCGTTRLPMPTVTPYRMEIQQGNFVSQEMVSQLKPGMSKEQVRFVMGTPLITDSFHADRWDYVFRRQRTNSKELEQRNLAVFFEDGKLKRVDGDVTPAASADPAAVKTTEATSEAQPGPAAVTAPPSIPGAQTAADTPKPSPAADKPAAAPAQDKPQEKSWWQKLKEKF